MGLDKVLYRTTKKCHAAKIAFSKLRAEYAKKVEELYTSKAWKPFIESLPRDEFGHFANDKFSAEQRKRVGVWCRGLHRIAKKVGIKLDKDRQTYLDKETYGLKDEDYDEEIYDWRKNWSLHTFIRDNFLEDKENDNLIPIYLSKEDCEKIVVAGFIEGFQEALDKWDEEHEVFYWAWY